MKCDLHNLLVMEFVNNQTQLSLEEIAGEFVVYYIYCYLLDYDQSCRLMIQSESYHNHYPTSILICCLPNEQ